MTEGILNGPGEGELLRNASGNRVSIVKGALPHLAVFEFTIEGPFDGPEPHTHADETDSFYILEGELDVYIDGETCTSTASGHARRPARSWRRPPESSTGSRSVTPAFAGS